LVYVKDTLLLWEMPTDFLELFHEVVVMTYLFEGSLMANYFKATEVPYTVFTLDKNRSLTSVHNRDEAVIKAGLREKITVIHDAKLNRIGTSSGKDNPLSASWFKRHAKGQTGALDAVKNNTYNFFTHKVTSGKSADNMWTTFKKVKAKITGKGYVKGFVSVNAKATNEFIEKRNLAYLANIFIHPAIFNYFDECGAEADQELFALSEMVQWIWRSQIRRGDPITVYIPSERMRRLFMNWLNNVGTVEMMAEAA
jgi:hypothetical protein